MFKINKFNVSNNLPVKKFADEEVSIIYGYPKDFTVKPVKEQIRRIAKIFDLNPNMAFEYEKRLPKLPKGADGWFAIASNVALAKKYFPVTIDESEKFCRTIQLVHQKIGQSRQFFNYRAGQINSEQLRFNENTSRALKLFAKNQQGDILIIPAQLGLARGGQSVRLVHTQFPQDKSGLCYEFGLSSDIVGQILLTHPERLANNNELYIDCPGDEFKLCGKNFSKSTAYLVSNGVLKFGAYSNDLARSGFGSATGFIPNNH